ncbi:MAG: DUF1631 family protein [Haliea sp.]|uniref:DUF1631 family protein n=1 Tax=Haliea sp. TaxID=1932666 RepID=UPI0032EAEB52
MSLLDSYRALSERELQDRFTEFLEDLSDHLLSMNPGWQPGQASRSTVAEGVSILQLQHKRMVAGYLDHLRQFHGNLTPPASENQWSDLIDEGGTLDLVDLNDFEDFLAIERIVAIGEDLYRVPLEALQIRVAELVGVAPLQLRLPEHTAQLSRALQLLLEEFHVPHRLTPRIYDYFVTHFIRQLGNFFAALNAHLAQGGIRPELEAEIHAAGSLLKKPEPAHRRAPSTPGKERPAASPIARPDGNTASSPGAASFSRPQQLYSSVINALNFKRETESGNLATSSGPVADAQTLASTLGQLQNSAKALQQIQLAGSIADFLMSEASGSKGLKQGGGLSTENRNQLEMVDSLFRTIRSQLDVSSELKPALDNLLIPLARLSLLEPQFFLDPDHPARSLVDKLAGLASSANFPNRMLESRVEGIVDSIVTDYDTDTAVFERALIGVEKLVQQQAHAHARNVERVVKTQEGKERLHRARAAVEAAVQETLPGPVAPKVLVDLIENGWRDLMILTHVKQGPDSQEWQEQLRALDLLASWLAQQQQEDTAEDLVVERSLEAEPFIDLLELQVNAALPGNVSIQAVLDELRSILAGETSILEVPIGNRAADSRAADHLRHKDIDKTPRLRRWLKRVEELNTGNWLNYHDKTGLRHRMQLAWISDDGARFLFVNDRGQKVAEMGKVQLARELSRGAQPPAPADKLSVVDQSMYGTLEHVQRTLSFARNHDALTRLINRETFLEQLARTLRHAQQHRSQHAMLWLNIDQFKLVNDVYDRISGDQVLLEFSRLLAQLHGKKTSSARLDADEFAVLLVDRDLDQAQAIAEKIRADIADSSVEIDGEKVSFTVSIGIAPIRDYSPNVDQIMANAHSAMQQAKQLGRNRVEQYRDSEDAVKSYRREQRQSREALEEALESERFVLRAQPIAKTAVSGHLPVTRHYELLLAIRDKNGKLASPATFIGSAERYGFMTLVDRWVVREAFRWISSLMDAQKVVPNLSINLSGASVTDDAFLDYLFEQISEFGVGTNRLCFEITETGTISNLVKAADFVRAFRNIGCKFSIDDFGTGLASHNYLRELPVDYVKIDGSFITNIHENRNDYAMVHSINDLAHFLGQETIAESVENEAIIAKLQEIGVDYLQGWGIGRPKPLAEVALDLLSLET